MPSRPLRLSLALLIAAAHGARAEDKITFNDHVQPALANACAGCHNPDKKKGGFDLTSVSGILAGGSGGAVAEPGNPGGSRLLKILRQQSEPKMPPDGPKLDDAKAALVEKWIAGGMPESKDSKPAARKQAAGLAFTAKAGKPDGPPPLPEPLPIGPARVVTRDGPVVALAASPWAPLLAVGGESQVSLHHLDTLMPLGVLPFPEGGPYVLRFSADGRWLLAAGGIGAVSGKAVVWEVATGRRRIEAGKERDAVLAADIRPDLSDLAIGGSSRLVKFYKATGGDAFQQIKKHTDWMLAAAYSPDGVLLASGDRNGGVQVWEADGQAEFHTLRGHELAITSLAWRPDGNLLATASEDGTIRFWDMNSGNSIKNWQAHPGGVLDAQWSQDGQLASGGRDKKVKIWKSDGSLVKEFTASAEAITRIAFAHDGKRVISGDFTGAITIWDTGGKALATLRANPPSVGDRIRSDTAALAALHAKLAPADAAWQAARAALSPLATERDALAGQLATAEKRVQDAAATLAAKRAASEKCGADLVSAGNAVKERTATIANLTTTAAAAATAFADLQKLHGDATTAQAAAISARDTATAAATAARSARDADPANQDLAARCAAAETTMAAAEAALLDATGKLTAALAAMQTGLAARDAAQAGLAAAQTDLTALQQAMAAARTRHDAADKESAEAGTAHAEASKALAPLVARRQEIDNHLPDLAKAETTTKSARDAIAADIQSTTNNLRRWQAEPLLLAARLAAEDCWEAESTLASRKEHADVARARLDQWLKHRDSARQDVIASRSWANPRLMLAQLAVNAARRQLATSQSAVEQAENSLAALRGHAKSLTTRFTTAVESGH